jgi:hypothetical protein
MSQTVHTNVTLGSLKAIELAQHPRYFALLARQRRDVAKNLDSKG